MNGIIIGTIIIISTIIICYTIYKIRTFKYFNKIVKKEIDFILDEYDKYEQMVNNKDEDYWKYSIDIKEFVKVLNTIKRVYNN